MCFYVRVSFWTRNYASDSHPNVQPSWMLNYNLNQRGVSLWDFPAALTRGFWHPMTSSIQNLSSFRRILIYHDTMETRGMVGVLNPPRLWLVEEHIRLKIINILTSHTSDCPHWIANVAPNLVLFEELIAADESKAWKITTMMMRQLPKILIIILSLQPLSDYSDLFRNHAC